MENFSNASRPQGEGMTEVLETFRIRRPLTARGPLFVPVFLGALAAATLVVDGSATLWAQDPQAEESTTDNEQALAVYADAANFQTNGELELAIEEWQKFLKDYPDDPLAPKAAHYLGVCYMQLAEPDYRAAAKAFQQALEVKEYDLREESLSNLGWCLYAAGSDPQSEDPEMLRASIAAYDQLLKEYPRSRFADRALFYMGEAHYALDQPREAIKMYDRLLGSSTGEKSALRCDALYARGLAFEDLKELDKAVAAYREMLASCADDPLAATVRIQLADVLVLQQKFAEAEQLFAEAIAAGGEEKARSIFRRAFVLTRLDRAEEAARAYESLIEEFPESPYAASALLAAAQSFYRAGQMEEARKRFQQILDSQSSLPAATEAAHWLSVLASREGDIARAEKIARDQIAKGTEGPYKTSLRMDAAEARSMQPEQAEEALAEFEQILSDSPDDPLTPRILYNAAFTALQLGQPQKALEFTSRFAEHHGDHLLRPDMQYIAAESHLMAGEPAEAMSEYEQLLEEADENPQRPLWVLRFAAAAYAAGQYETVIERLNEELASLPEASQRAEAYFLIGSSHLASQRQAEAVEALQQGVEADPAWIRAGEMRLRLASAQHAAGDEAAAKSTWRQVIGEFPNARYADQARYQLAQRASEAGEMEEAVELYEQLLREEADPNLRPFALYGRGWSLLQMKKYDAALDPLNELLDQHAQHSLADDARLARGICLRRLGKNDEAAEDLQSFLEENPEGTNLGHALYELAMIDREQDRPAAAVEKLQRVVEEVPQYPALSDVLYELAWSLRDSGKADEATAQFTNLVSRFPDAEQAAEASYLVGQHHYREKAWQPAGEAYAKAAEQATDPELREKSLYRLGWSHFQQGQYAEAVEAFARQAEAHPEGNLSIDALMMIGESHFKSDDYQAAFEAFERARATILERDGEGRKFSDPAEQRVRELVFLHGGQSAGQLGKWDEAIAWYQQLRGRYPASSYLPQVFYETGYAYQQLDDDPQALKFYAEVADNYRDATAARARFMMGEIHFKRRELAPAISEFKRVMYGFGAEAAPESVKDWQAKSGFEAGRCAELLVQENRGQRREKAIELAKRYYGYVTELHPRHELAAKARERLDVLHRL